MGCAPTGPAAPAAWPGTAPRQAERWPQPLTPGLPREARTERTEIKMSLGLTATSQPPRSPLQHQRPGVPRAVASPDGAVGRRAGEGPDPGRTGERKEVSFHRPCVLRVGEGAAPGLRDELLGGEGPADQPAPSALMLLMKRSRRCHASRGWGVTRANDSHLHGDGRGPRPSGAEAGPGALACGVQGVELRDRLTTEAASSIFPRRPGTPSGRGLGSQTDSNPQASEGPKQLLTSIKPNRN